MLEVIQSLHCNFEQRFGSLTQHRAEFQFTTNPLNIESQEDISEELRWLCGDSFDEELLNLKERELWNVKFSNLAKDLEHIYREKDCLSATKQWKELSSLQNVSDLAFGAWQELPDSFTVSAALRLKLTSYEPNIANLLMSRQFQASH